MIAPTKSRNGKAYPDLFNHFPARLAMVEEARTQGWLYFFDGRLCNRGHRAPRPVSNQSACVDRRREARGLPLIGSKSQVQPLAASAAKLSERPPVQAPSVPAAPAPPFVWIDQTRTSLLKEWIDTGDIAEARDRVGCKPSEYLEELQKNPDFAAAVRRTEPQAEQMLAERAKQLALKGNPQLLMRLLPTVDEKYSERVNVNMRKEVTLTADQQVSKIMALLTKHRHHFDSAEDAQLFEALPVPAKE